MNEKPEKFIDDNGLRLDGRTKDQIRDIKIEVGVLSRADGSCYLEMGKNKVIAAVYGPREVHPRHQQSSTRAIVRFKYNMASFSVEDRKRPGPDRRSMEVSKVSREAIESVVFTDYYPKSAIDIFVEVLQADAGTRTAAINAASVAMADAGIPMRGLISACAVGKVDDTLVVDLNKDEDNYGQADMPIAMTPEGKITLLQMDGHLTQEEFKEALEMAQEGCRQVYEHQRKALMDYYNRKAGEVQPAVETLAGVVKDKEPEPEATSATAGKEEGTAEKVAAEEEADEKVAAEEEADEKVAAEEEVTEKVAAEEEADEKVAAEEEVTEKVVAEEEADEKVAAEEEADEKVAVEEEVTEKVAAEEEADEKIAAEEEVTEKVAVEEEVTEKVAAEEEADEKVEPVEESTQTDEEISPDEEGEHSV